MNRALTFSLCQIFNVCLMLQTIYIADGHICLTIYLSIHLMPCFLQKILPKAVTTLLSGSELLLSLGTVVQFRMYKDMQSERDTQ